MSKAEKHLHRAAEIFRRGDRAGALREYLGVLKQDPLEAAAAQGAAGIYATQGQRKEAGEIWAALLDLQLAAGGGPEAAESWHALLLVSQPAPDRCLRVAEAFRRDESTRREAVEAYHAAVSALSAEGKPAEALAAQEQLVALEASVVGYCRLGELADETGDRRKAAAAFLRAGSLESGAEALEHYALAHQLDLQSVEAAVLYARALLSAGEGGPEKAVSILQQFLHGPKATAESRALYGRALLASGRVQEAEPFFWEMVREDAGDRQYLLSTIGKMLDSGYVALAVGLARRWEEFQQRHGRIREHAGVMREFAAQRVLPLEFLVYLSALYDAADWTADLADTLLRLFEFYYEAGNYIKAGECLDRAAETGPQTTGFEHRLEMLRGKIDDHRLRAISRRLGWKAEDPRAPAAEASDVPARLEDLVLQAEMFLQYSVRSRAIEILEQIRRQFPGEELRHEKLRQLLVSAGLRSGEAKGAGEMAIADLTGAAEITQRIYRKGSVRSVLLTAANEVGRYWNASRCAVVMCAPGKSPSLAFEYCAPGIAPSHVQAAVKLVEVLQPKAMSYGLLSIGSGNVSPDLAMVRQFAAGLGISSLAAIPLLEEDQHVGLMVVQHCGTPYHWRSADLVVLKTVAEQTVLALANARLRSLVKNLAITEEHSGLLKRSSLLDVLLSEVRRGIETKAQVTLMLMNFGEANAPEALPKMDAAAKVIAARIRENDLAVRYGPTTVALVLGDTDAKSALLTISRLRGLLDGAIPFACGIAEAITTPPFDAVDSVTELINRAEDALHRAAEKEGDRVYTMVPEVLEQART